MKKLVEQDCRAIDLFLNREAASPEPSTAFMEPIQDSPERLKSVAKILSLLQALPSFDPPLDLASRTIQRIENAQAGIAIDSASRLTPASADQNISRPLAL